MHIPCDWATRRALLIPVRAAARAGVVKRIVNDRFDGLLPFDEWRADWELTSVIDGSPVHFHVQLYIRNGKQ